MKIKDLPYDIRTELYQAIIGEEGCESIAWSIDNALQSRNIRLKTSYGAILKQVVNIIGAKFESDQTIPDEFDYQIDQAKQKVNELNAKLVEAKHELTQVYRALVNSLR